jgi:hypothetical protein
VLASLAMLAPKGALRVAPGGSAPLFPSAPHHGPTISGRDEKAGSSAEPESWIAGVRHGGRGDISILENQGTFLFCVDITAPVLVRPTQECPFLRMAWSGDGMADGILTMGAKERVRVCFVREAVRGELSQRACAERLAPAPRHPLADG